MKIAAHEMNPHVAHAMGTAGRTWKWLYFFRLVSSAVIVWALGVAALAGLVLAGWLTSRVAFSLGVGALTLLAVLAFVVAGMVALASGRRDSWLAARLEGAAPQLLDRVNALVHLRDRAADWKTRAFFRAIGFQAGHTLSEAGRVRAIAGRWTALLVAVAVGAVFGVIHFLRETEPWERLNSPVAALGAPEDTFDLALPEDGALEMKAAWGEVRITEPGGDLKLTKVDVLPLTVEAASNRRLQQADWTTGVNGGEARDRPLPAPHEPNYAVYEPLLYLDELQVDDWDVVSYSAAATTEDAARFASEIYFVEIRPFREEMMKLEAAGGADGKKALESLRKLSRLIEKEQEILRGTHRQDQKPAATKTEREQDQAKLAQAQRETFEAAGNLYGEIAATDHMDVGTVLDQLAQARDTMERAAGELERPDNPAAGRSERLALQQLVESRKDLVTAIAQSGGDGEGSGEETQPVAGMKPELKDVLKDMAEFRDVGQAAQAAVRQAREAQEKLAKEAAGAGASAELAARQESIARALRDFQERVPGAFEGVSEPVQAADAAMQSAADALTAGTGEAAAEAQGAAQALAGLEQAMQRRDALKATGDVYKMKAVLDDEAAALQKNPLTDSGELAQSGERLDRAKTAMEEALRETKAGEMFGPELEKALAGQPGRDLENAARQMQSGSAEGVKPALASLAEIEKAFQASQPGMLQGMEKPGAEGDSQGLGDAARMLNGLAERMGAQRELSPEDLRKQLQEARLALLETTEGRGEPTLIALAADLEKMSGEVDLHVDEAALRKLVDRLENYRLELADRDREKPVDPALLKVDAEKVPVEFRERVRRYFQKLSEG